MWTYKNPFLWVAGAFVVGLAFIFCYYECIAGWLDIELSPPPQKEGDSKTAETVKEAIEVDSTTISRFEFISRLVAGWAGFFAICIAAWRNHELQRQATAAIDQVKESQKQANAAQNQAETARKTQVSEQLTKAMELLAQTDNKGTPLKEARVGGLYSLESLAHADPEGYGVRVMKIIVSYICDNAQKTALTFPNKPEKRTKPSPLGEDVKTAFHMLQALYYAYGNQIDLANEDSEGWQDLDFSGADFRQLDFLGIRWIERPYLQSAQLQGANLMVAKFQGTNLRWAQLQGANLSVAQLHGADLMGAQLCGADLRSAQLQGANLTVAQLWGVNLNQAELDFSVWRATPFHTSKALLEHFLNEDEACLSQGTIDTILKEFDEKGNKGLWKPKSAKIFCDEAFTTLQEYGHSETKLTKRNDNNVEWWQTEWKKVLDSIVQLRRLPAILGLIAIHVYDILTGDRNTHCAQGLRLAIHGLDNYITIYDQLPDEYKKWLDEDSSNPPKPSDA